MLTTKVQLAECREAWWRRHPRAANLEVPLLRVIVSAPEGVMVIGERLRALREQKNLSQGDIEKRTGLLRCYISRA
jgi:hypothetical protein